MTESVESDSEYILYIFTDKNLTASFLFLFTDNTGAAYQTPEHYYQWLLHHQICLYFSTNVGDALIKHQIRPPNLGSNCNLPESN